MIREGGELTRVLQQAFELCVVKEWNLSHEKLRSREMQKKLRDLHINNDPFWNELNRVNDHHPRPVTGAVIAEDIIANPEDEDELDDSDIRLKDVVAATHKKPIRDHGHKRISTDENGGLMAAVDVENIDEVPKAVEGVDEEEGRGKRKKTANKLYRLSDFTRHWDEEASDDGCT
jgi:hypothetical protein